MNRRAAATAAIAFACALREAGGAAAFASSRRIAAAAAATHIRAGLRGQNTSSEEGAGCAWLGRRTGRRCSQLSPAFGVAAKLRGGEDDGWGDDDAADDLQEGAFAEDGIVKRALKAWQKTPLITRNYMRATAGLTVFSFLFLNNEWPDCLLLKWRSTFTRLQLWRPVAPFLYYGPLGVSYVVTLHFVWTYMSELERRLYNAPQDFLVMVLFGATSLLLVSTLVKLDSRLLGHSLSCFLVYVWSRQNEGMEANIMDMFTLRVELLPWFFVAQTLLIDGQPPVLDLVGIFVGYLYQFLRLKKHLNAPKFLADFFNTPAIRRDYQQKFATEFGQAPNEDANFCGGGDDAGADGSAAAGADGDGGAAGGGAGGSAASGGGDIDDPLSDGEEDDDDGLL